MSDYADIVQQWVILTSQAAAANNYTPPTDFSNIIPFSISYTEGRIVRDLGMLAQRTQDSSLTFSGTTRSLDMTQMATRVQVPEGLAMITPAGRLPNQGKSVPFLWTSLDVIDQIWPDQTLTLDPTTAPAGTEWFWSMSDAQTIVVAPIPAGAFVANITGLFYPTPLSATNPTTYLSAYYPNLYIAGGMVYNIAYMRNFGAMSDNANMGLTWEAEYKKLQIEAMLEEQRRRGQGVGFSQNLPSPIATPQRTG